MEEEEEEEGEGHLIGKGLHEEGEASFLSATEGEEEGPHLAQGEEVVEQLKLHAPTPLFCSSAQ